MATKRTIEFEGNEITVQDITFVYVVSPDLVEEIIEIDELNSEEDEVQIWSVQRAEELLENVKDWGNVSEEDIEEFAEHIKLLEAKVVDCIVVSKW